MSDSHVRRNQRTALWLCGIGVLILVVVVPAQSALAQGDGPRTHWKEMLTGTNLFTVTSLNMSGNVNPFDPAHAIQPGADFDADVFLLGFSRSFSFFEHTATGSLLLPVGELEGEVAGLFSGRDSVRGLGG